MEPVCPAASRDGPRRAMTCVWGHWGYPAPHQAYSKACISALLGTCLCEMIQKSGKGKGCVSKCVCVCVCHPDCRDSTMCLVGTLHPGKTADKPTPSTHAYTHTHPPSLSLIRLDYSGPMPLHHHHHHHHHLTGCVITALDQPIHNHTRRNQPFVLFSKFRFFCH